MRRAWGLLCVESWGICGMDGENDMTNDHETCFMVHDMIMKR